MTIEELRRELRKIVKGARDPELQHYEADELLIKFIDDTRVTNLYNKLTRWYA